MPPIYTVNRQKYELLKTNPVALAPGSSQSVSWYRPRSQGQLSPRITSRTQANSLAVLPSPWRLRPILPGPRETNMFLKKRCSIPQEFRGRMNIRT